VGLEHFLETMDDEDLHVLVDHDFVTGANPAVDKGFLSHFLDVAIARCHRVGLDDQVSRFVEAGVGTVGTLDTGNTTEQESTARRPPRHWFQYLSMH